MTLRIALGQSGVGTRMTAKCATCGSVRHSPVFGSWLGVWLNAEYSRNSWRCKLKQPKKVSSGQYRPKTVFNKSRCVDLPDPSARKRMSPRAVARISLDGLNYSEARAPWEIAAHAEFFGANQQFWEACFRGYERLGVGLEPSENAK